MPRRGAVLALLFLVAVRAAAQPANDDCANGIEVTALPFTHTVDNSTATTEPGDLSCNDPGNELGGLQEPHTVWYRYTATDDVLLTIETNLDFSFTPVATVGQGSCGALQIVNCSVDAKETVVPVRAGGTVYVSIADEDTSGGTGGPVEVSITSTPIPDGTPIHLGADFQVNTVFLGYQKFPDVAATPDGGFVVAWRTGYFPGGDDVYEVVARRFDASGAPLGSDFLVNSYTTESQEEPAIATDAAGNFVVVWHSYDQAGDFDESIFARRFDATGAPVGTEFLVNAHTTDSQRDAAVAQNAAGQFVIVWTSRYQDGSDWGIFGRRYDAAGVPLGGEFQVNTHTTDTQRHAKVAIGADGGFVVAWESYGQAGFGYGVFGRRYDSAGVPGPEFQVNTPTFDYLYPDVALDPSGGFLVVWSTDAVRGRRYDATGSPLGGEFAISPATDELDYRRTPSVSSNPAGEFVIIWGTDYSYGEIDTGCEGVSGRRLSLTGVPIGAQFQVNTYTVGCQRFPSVSVADTGFVVVHEDYTEFPGRDGHATGIFATRFDFTCPATPRAGCKQPTILHKGQLILRDKTPDKSDSLTWKWLRGGATTVGEIGNPLGTDDYTLCLYDDTTGLLAQALVPAGGTCGTRPCWKDLAGLGFKYVDKAGTRAGIQKLVLKSGIEGKAKVILKGKGDALTMPALPLGLPVRAQLTASTGTCWEAGFEAGGLVENSVEEFSAKAEVD